MSTGFVRTAMRRLTRILFSLRAGLQEPHSGPRRARRACEGAARGVGAPASDRAGVRGGAPVWLIGLAALTTAVVVLLKVVPSSVEGQAQNAATPASTPAKADPAAKTPWGEPDLQGIWTYDYETPLQRPARYANKEFFTDQERAELDKQRVADGQHRRDLSAHRP